MLRPVRRWIATLAVSMAIAALAPPRARAEAVAPAPTIALYTVDPSQELFAMFGHAALCVFDPRDPDGRCYNYGTGAFDDLGELVRDFLRQRSIFWVSAQPLESFLEDYREEDRTVWRQVLPLTDDQARRLADELDADHLDPARGRYVYDHRLNNCATRLRDHLDAVLGGRLRAGNEVALGPTWRDLLMTGFAQEQTVQAAAELLLAHAASDHPSRWAAMAYPAVMRVVVDDTLGAPAELVQPRVGPPLPNVPGAGKARLAVLAWLLAALVGVLGGVAAWTGWRWLGRVGLVVAGLALGAIALVVWGLMLYARVPDLSWNVTALVLVPTDLALVALRGRWLRGYLRARLVGLALVGVAGLVGLAGQPVAIAIVLAGLPLAAAALVTRPGAPRTG